MSVESKLDKAGATPSPIDIRLAVGTAGIAPDRAGAVADKEQMTTSAETTAAKESRPARTSTAPIEQLAKRYVEEHPNGPSPWRVFAQLGIPEDLRYVTDGLKRSLVVLQDHGDVLDELFDHAPCPVLRSVELCQVITDLLPLAAEREWNELGRSQLLMARMSSGAGHPLHHHSLGTLHAWALHFYTSNKALHGGLEVHLPVERFIGDYLPYAIAAQSSCPADRYESFCRDWWMDRRLPARPLIPDPEISSRLERATLVARRMSNGDNVELLAALTNPRDSTFRERLASAVNDFTLTSDQRDAAKTIALLLDCLLPTWRPKGGRRRSSGTRKRLNPKIEDGFVRVAPEVVCLRHSTESGIQVCEFSIASEPADGVAAEDEALMPMADRLSDRSVSTVIVDRDDPDLKRASSRAIHSRYVDTHIRRDLFAHPLLKTRLLADDANAIWAAFKLPPNDPALRELLPLLHASMAMGVSIEAAHEIELADGPPPDATTTRTVRYRRDLRCWEIRVTPPAYENEDLVTLVRDGVTFCLERAVAPWLQMPDVTGFSAMLDKFGVSGRKVLSERRYTRKARRLLQVWIETVTGDAHATVSACAGHLFHRVLASAKGDSAAAYLLTGSVHGHARSAIHYSHYMHERLVDIYRDALANASGVASGQPGMEEQFQLSSAGFGARRVPTRDAVTELLAWLRREIDRARDANDITRWHNLYTAHTIAGLVLSLGLRAIIDPHFHDLDEQIATYIDKARSDYHRRVSAIPDALVAHLQHYAEFVRIINARQGSRGIPPTMAFAYYDLSTGEFEPFRPAHFEQIVGEVFPMELYSLRRFMRTSLIESPTVKGEDVDSFMGHWREGVSPHDPLSTYPAQRLSVLASGPVSAILKQVGFTPVRSVA